MLKRIHPPAPIPTIHPSSSPTEVVRTQPPVALGIAGAAVAVLLRLIPEKTRASSSARACVVLVAAVVSAVHLETFGQACPANAGSGEVWTPTGPPHASPNSCLVPASSHPPGGLRAAQLLHLPAVPPLQLWDPFPGARGQAVTLAWQPCLTHLDCAGSLLRPRAAAAATGRGGRDPAGLVSPSSLTKEIVPWTEHGLGRPQGLGSPR